MFNIYYKRKRNINGNYSTSNRMKLSRSMQEVRIFSFRSFFLKIHKNQIHLRNHSKLLTKNSNFWNGSKIPDSGEFEFSNRS